MKKLVFIACLFLTLWSCKPSIPGNYLQPGEMEDILYDYHISQSMANVTVSGNMETVSQMRLAYKTSVLKKHGVTEAQFDSSLVYYLRHTEQLHAVYDNLAKRLSNEAEALGSSARDMEVFGDMSSKGDTTDIWPSDRSMILSPYEPFNMQDFTIKADTSFHKGDKFMLSFDTQFIYQDGMRDGVVMLAVKFSNDSVASSVFHVSSDTHQILQVADNQQKGIKEVKGFFLLSKGNGIQTQTLKILCITNIRLVRMHTKPLPQTPTVPVDSTNVSSAAQDKKIARQATSVVPNPNVGRSH